jgi:hypothetical protein
MYLRSGLFSTFRFQNKTLYALLISPVRATRLAHLIPFGAFLYWQQTYSFGVAGYDVQKTTIHIFTATKTSNLLYNLAA